jgi:hypothetical protein
VHRRFANSTLPEAPVKLGEILQPLCDIFELDPKLDPCALDAVLRKT